MPVPLVPVAIGGGLIKLVARKLLSKTVGKGKPIPFGGVKEVTKDALPKGFGKGFKDPKGRINIEKNPITSEKQLVHAYRGQLKELAKKQAARSQPKGTKLPLPKKYGGKIKKRYARGGPVGYSQRWKTGRKG